MINKPGKQTDNEMKNSETLSFGKCIFRKMTLLVLVFMISQESYSQTWSGVGAGGMNDWVYATAVYNGDLIAAGKFTSAGGVSANHIARWDGTSWHPLGLGVNAKVWALFAHNGLLYVGGEFTEAGGIPMNFIAIWDGTQWLNDLGDMGSIVTSFAWYNNNLTVGGYFTDADGLPLNYVAQHTSAGWAALGTGVVGVQGQVMAMEVYNNELIVAGFFNAAGGSPANHIAKWNGLTWSALGSGISNIVYSLTNYNGNLIAGGLFLSAGGVPANHIASWNGSSWSAMGTGMSGPFYQYVFALKTYNGNLFAGGYFTQSGGVQTNGIAKWNGSSWSNLGSGLFEPGNVCGTHTLCVYGHDLIVGGLFNTAGSAFNTSHIASWNEPTPGPDTIPGSAISINGTTNYATTDPVALGNTNTITLSTWIKIAGTQPSSAGVIFTGDGGATGLFFKTSNRIGYIWNNVSTTSGYVGGPIIPTNQWTHLALVITPANATIYVNGTPYINNVANSAVNFITGFNLGNNKNNTTRTITGEMDEVCFYNRSLSQNEIRELMHLTKNHNTIDPSLKTYYQCNETGSIVNDWTSFGNATLLGTATHVVSTAPVGSGTSALQIISTNGIKSFANEGVVLNFGTGTLPNGEICVTRLNLQPDSMPPNKSFANAADKYWIINNYGSNSSFTSLVTTSFTGFGNISAADATVPNKYKLFRRSTGDYTSVSWNLIDSATCATSGVDGVLDFSGTANTSFNKQFTIVSDSIIVNTITLKLITYIEGYYAGAGTMQPVLFNAGVSNDPSICDSIIVEIHDPFIPSIILATDTVTLHVDGAASIQLPQSFNGSSVYIVIRSRNSIETWSKLPVTLSSFTTFDFTVPY